MAYDGGHLLRRYVLDDTKSRAMGHRVGVSSRYMKESTRIVDSQNSHL